MQRALLGIGVGFQWGARHPHLHVEVEEEAHGFSAPRARRMMQRCHAEAVPRSDTGPTLQEEAQRREHGLWPVVLGIGLHAACVWVGIGARGHVER